MAYMGKWIWVTKSENPVGQTVFLEKKDTICPVRTSGDEWHPLPVLTPPLPVHLFVGMVDSTERGVLFWNILLSDQWRRWQTMLYYFVKQCGEQNWHQLNFSNKGLELNILVFLIRWTDKRNCEIHTKRKNNMFIIYVYIEWIHSDESQAVFVIIRNNHHL